MKIKINKKEVEIPENSTISDILLKDDIDEPVCVEVFLNKKRIHYEHYSETVLNENDEIEYIYLFASG